MKFPDFTLFLLTCMFILSCGNEPTATPATRNDPHPTLPSNTGKHLNISVLIDLSDRINSKADGRQPVQAERDVNIINVLSSAVKKNVSAHGSFKAKARYNVYFHPEPSDSRIRDIARKLSITWVNSTEAGQARQNKLNYQQLDENFSGSLQQIYNLAQTTGSYPGSDIWRFMKDEAAIKTVETDTAYRNILVILTDGYLYYQNGQRQLPGTNRYNYIERGTTHFSRFRDATLLASEFDQKDYGLIPATAKLNNLEVLVLECRPPDEHPEDFDIMQKYWCKWFAEMGVKHAEIYKSQLPAYHERIISGFLQKNSGICQ